MADGRELPDEARTRRTSGELDKRTARAGAIGPPAEETVVPSRSQAQTDAPSGKHDGPSTGGTQAIFSAAGTGEQKAGGAPPGQATVLFGKYLVVRKLGEGAMGEVWLVRHRELGVERALKLINLARFSDPEMRARARREARAMALFSHPNAVTVHDANADGDMAYIEMEYIRGRSLNRVMQPGTPMPLEWVAEMVQQLCAVLEVAHAHGIVHRDLKPSNMMLVGDEPQEREHLKILDFGIAKILHAEEQGGDDLRTWSGAIIGTPAYMSPEQINTEAGQLDGRSDLYTVGVILFEMLTGRRPFTSASFRLTFDHLHTAPPSFADVNPDLHVPAEIEQLVRRCLEKDPKRRPRSARELGDEFRRLAAPPEPAFEPARPPLRRRAAWAAAGLLAALTVVASVWMLRPPAPARPPFAIRASHKMLKLRAGDEARLTIVSEGERPGGRATVVAPKTPRGVRITREASEGAPGVDVFKVETEPDTSPGPIQLAFLGKAGSLERKATVSLTIEPAEFALPAGFRPAPDSRPVRDNAKLYHSRIVPAVAGLEAAEFLYVKKNRSGEPDSFYMMRDKVSNAVFAVFARAKPEALAGSKWKAAEAGAEMQPAMNVTADEACRFADWLGQAKVRVRLPSTAQWDKAAGYYDTPRGKGPFRASWTPESDTIALGREEPAPVGSSPDDVSPYGCRDMAGNGMEWTRNGTSQGVVLPLPPGDATRVILRGQSYELSTPYDFDKIVDQDARLEWDSSQSSPDLGFRLVIDEI